MQLFFFGGFAKLRPALMEPWLKTKTRTKSWETGENSSPLRVSLCAELKEPCRWWSFLQKRVFSAKTGASSSAPVCRSTARQKRGRGLVEGSEGMWSMQVCVHFSLCQLLIMLNYTFNTSAPLWTFLRVWGQAFPVSVNDPTSGELSCCTLVPPTLSSLALPPSFTPSVFWPLLCLKRRPPPPPPPPIPDLHHSQMSQIVWGLTPVTRRASHLSNTNKQGKECTPRPPHVDAVHAKSCVHANQGMQMLTSQKKKEDKIAKRDRFIAGWCNLFVRSWTTRNWDCKFQPLIFLFLTSM